MSKRVQTTWQAPTSAQNANINSSPHHQIYPMLMNPPHSPMVAGASQNSMLSSSPLMSSNSPMPSNNSPLMQYSPYSDVLPTTILPSLGPSGAGNQVGVESNPNPHSPDPSQVVAPNSRNRKLNAVKHPWSLVPVSVAAQRYQLLLKANKTYTVGRSRSNDIIIASPYCCSKKTHCTLEVSDSEIIMTHLSSQGTYINALKHLTGRSVLKDNDLIGFGCSTSKKNIEYTSELKYFVYRVKFKCSTFVLSDDDDEEENNYNNSKSKSDPIQDSNDDDEKAIDSTTPKTRSRKRTISESSDKAHIKDETKQLLAHLEDEIAWICKKEPIVGSTNHGCDLIDVQNLINEHQAVLAEINNHESRLDAVVASGEKMLKDNLYSNDEIRLRLDLLKKQWASLKEKANQRKQDLEKSLQVHKYLAELNKNMIIMREKNLEIEMLSSTESSKDEDSCRALWEKNEALISDVEAFQNTIQSLGEELINCISITSY